MPLRLFVHSRFRATHSLEGNESPHPHDWTVRLELRAGKLEKGKLVDLVLAREGLESILARLRDTFLNENEFAGEEVRSAPTCETLSRMIYETWSREVLPKLQALFPETRLSTVRIGIADPGSPILGQAEYSE